MAGADRVTRQVIAQRQDAVVLGEIRQTARAFAAPGTS
ncbi:hypothetical protein BC739_005867 [Kutzneria viridogrisea]|uniref:Uncharacterized protein n=1 Tax=Kutzneria viridogrisea TaxID=47990 RepID=A0ABR6BPM5_9PSEU|nr:hypothetical protein [Kutzneria viridogrisea]